MKDRPEVRMLDAKNIVDGFVSGLSEAKLREHLTFYLLHAWEVIERSEVAEWQASEEFAKYIASHTDTDTGKTVYLIPTQITLIKMTMDHLQKEGKLVFPIDISKSKGSTSGKPDFRTPDFN